MLQKRASQNVPWKVCLSFFDYLLRYVCCFETICLGMTVIFLDYLFRYACHFFDYLFRYASNFSTICLGMLSFFDCLFKEGFALSCKPRLPLLRPHELSVWSPWRTALHDDCSSLDSSVQINVIDLIWLQLVIHVINDERKTSLVWPELVCLDLTISFARI